MIEVDDKLLKIIELARQGIGGEKDTAVAIVRRRCGELGLDFEEVMTATEEKEFMLELSIKNSTEMDIVAQVCFRFASTPKHPDLKVNARARVFFYTTTPGKHIETVNAASIYLKAFRVERKKTVDELMNAFVIKHRLFRQYKRPGNDSPEPPAMDVEKQLRISFIAKGLDDVAVHKQIGSGK